MNDKKALIALMDLALAMVDAMEAPTATQRSKAMDRVAAERREVAGWRETLYLLSTEANRDILMEAATRQLDAEIDSELERRPPRRQERATRPQGHGAVVADGQAARTAVEATERRMRAWYGLEGLEADDSRITDGHKQAPCGDGWCTCGMCVSQQASEHKRYGGKPGCGCSVCQCARSVGG